LSLLADFDNSYLGETARALRTEIASAKPAMYPSRARRAVDS
jgi:hypothetical protein